jgi:inward rectifier potassium channel
VKDSAGKSSAVKNDDAVRSAPRVSQARAPEPIPRATGWKRPSQRVEDEVRVIGARPRPFRDIYHAFLRVRWSFALGLIVLGYLGLNALFAVGYLLAGGVVNARPGSLADAFYFSIQTMGTIGYGAMYPVGPVANALVIAESVTGLVVTALATGLVFAKFSQPTSLIGFSDRVAIGPMDGVPTLMFRVGNERDSRIIEAHIRVSMVRTELTREGSTFYRMYDLVLSRERSPALSRSWTVLHPITPQSPLFGMTPELMKRDEVELLVTIVGVDDTSLQPVHARCRYLDDDVVWGARPSDMMSVDEDGVIVIDVRRFHDLVATEPTPEFPYPAL